MSTDGAKSSSRVREAHTSAGYVLHTYPFRETSLIVEMFTRGYGRLGLMAKGARRPRSAMRGSLMAFQPLQVTWSGTAELKTLHRVEWEAGHLQLQGTKLICGFYLNELLLKLLPREDPHEALFDAYERATQSLRKPERPARLLRRFERDLLREMGYALVLETDVEGHAVQPESRYVYQMERGPMLASNQAAGDCVVRGKTLLDLSRSDGGAEDDELTDQECRALMRQAIGHYLNGQELRTRQLLRELQEL